MKEIEIIVRGRVQRVMFRDFTQRSARKLQIRGTVQNMADGSVKVIAQGETANLDAFIAKLHTGPLFSRVDDVSVQEKKPDVTFSDFSIVYNDTFIDRI